MICVFIALNMYEHEWAQQSVFVHEILAFDLDFCV